MAKSSKIMGMKRQPANELSAKGLQFGENLYKTIALERPRKNVIITFDRKRQQS
jgi:hypothetical protein